MADPNKKKRKVNELIDYWQTSKAELPPPLELGDSILSGESTESLFYSSEQSTPDIKRKKIMESSEGSHEYSKPAPQRTASKPKISSGNLSERRLRERQRNEAANEILTSERSYVNSLDMFVTNFSIPLATSKMHGVLTEAERNLICGDISVILQLNKAFLTQVTERMRLFTSKTPIADIFLSFMPHFKMYTSYCCKYSQISELVARLKNENKAFKSFLKKAENNSKHPIADFLIAPVQRVPRLALLLESLLKFTDPVHPDYSQLNRALSATQDAARMINTKMAEVEVRQKVVSIQRRFDPMLEDFLDGPLVQPHRTFLYEGILARKNAPMLNDWSDSEESESDIQEEGEKGKYYCFLFNDIFLVGTSVGTGKSRRLVYETSFELSTTFVKDDMNSLCFQLVNPRCTYIWLTTSSGNAADWKKNIEDAVDAMLKQNPALANQRNRVQVTLNDETNEWEAEIRAPSRTVRIDPIVYREEVLENTQKHLTIFMHEHHDKLAKHRTAQSSPLKNKSMFQRVKESILTPKKRQSLKVGGGDENNAAATNAGTTSPSSFTSPPSRKSEKLESAEDLDGISCINRHLEYLNQELDEVREIRRAARGGERPAGLTRTVTSPIRGFGKTEPSSQSNSKSASDSTKSLKSSISSGRLILGAIDSVFSGSDKLHKRRSKMIRLDKEKRQTLLTNNSGLDISAKTPASGRRQTVVVPPTLPSPVEIPPRAKDTEHLSKRTSSKSLKKSRASIGGTDSKSILNAPLPKPLIL